MYTIGIDLGTSNSVVSVWRRGQIETIRVDGRPTFPSVVSVRTDGSELSGLAAKRRAMMEPAQSITSAKRFIGDGKTEWSILGKTYTPISVSSIILGRLKSAAENFLGQPVTEAVITVPAYFNNNQKRDTKLAGEAVGLKVLQLLPEPTAAAVSYGLDKGNDQTLLVYDLGGGTFDVSVLKVKGNLFSVIAVDGDFSLGGDDFDLLLVDHLITLIEERTEADLGVFRRLFRRKRPKNDPDVSKDMLVARQRLKEEAEQAKIELSECDSAHITIPEILGTSLDEEITLSQYNKMISPLVDRTINKTHEVLKSAGLSADDIDRVILVGGSTRNTLIKERITEAIKEPWIAERVDEVVSEGAAIVAGSLSSPDEDLTPIEFHNVTPFSLGVCSIEKDGSSDYINSIIIKKNSRVPCNEARPYEVQTQVGNDNNVEVYMLQGESQNPADCLALGKYIFSGVAHDTSGLAKVEIEYGYDDSGIITASAVELASNKQLSLRIEDLPDDPHWLDVLRKQTGSFRSDSLKLIVTPPGYDDVGNVLRSLELPFDVYRGNSTVLDCDILFWNCLADVHPPIAAVREYVYDGGCLYASCCAAQHFGDAFSDAFNLKSTGCRSETISADVVDTELNAALGDSLNIRYNMAACFTITSISPASKVLLREAGSGQDVMVMAPFGKGYIFYTCFHHHDSLSSAEKKLLQLLVMKQISVVSGIPIESVSKNIQGVF